MDSKFLNIASVSKYFGNLPRGKGTYLWNVLDNLCLCRHSGKQYKGKNQSQ